MSTINFMGRCHLKQLSWKKKEHADFYTVNWDDEHKSKSRTVLVIIRLIIECL